MRINAFQSRVYISKTHLLLLNVYLFVYYLVVILHMNMFTEKRVLLTGSVVIQVGKSRSRANQDKM